MTTLIFKDKSKVKLDSNAREYIWRTVNKKEQKTFKIYEGDAEKFSTQTTFQKPHEGLKSFCLCSKP